MGGSTGNLSGLVQAFLLAAFFGLVGALVMGVLGNMGWSAAGGLGLGLAAFLALFFAIILGGPSQRFESGSSAPYAATVAQEKVAVVTQSASPAVATVAPPVAAFMTPVASEPAAIEPARMDDAAVAAAGAGTKPVGLSAPRGGQGDNLKTIEGIGPVLEKLCHDMGIYHFDQIAGWGPGEVAWMNANLKGFKGRVGRDKWVAQARLIGSVGIEEFKRRAEINDY